MEIYLWDFVSGSKAPLIWPVGLFGRGRSDLPLLLLLVHPEVSASETVVWEVSEGTAAFFTFFFLLALRENHWQSILFLLLLFSKPNHNMLVIVLGASCTIM